LGIVRVEFEALFIGIDGIFPFICVEIHIQEIRSDASNLNRSELNGLGPVSYGPVIIVR